MVTYYCTSCWHSCMSDKHRCQVCGSTGKFCTEQEYGEQMIRNLNHSFREYRIDALQKLREIRFGPAVPFIANMMATEKDPIIMDEAKRTLTEIRSYLKDETTDELKDCFRSSETGIVRYTPRLVSLISPRL